MGLLKLLKKIVIKILLSQIREYIKCPKALPSNRGLGWGSFWASGVIYCLAAVVWVYPRRPIPVKYGNLLASEFRRHVKSKAYLHIAFNVDGYWAFYGLGLYRETRKNGSTHFLGP